MKGALYALSLLKNMSAASLKGFGCLFLRQKLSQTISDISFKLRS